MDDQIKKAFDYASDASKQLLTLSTGVIALTITFSKDFLGSAASAKAWLVWAWVFYLVSIIGGCWYLLAAAGSMAKKAKPDIYDFNTVLPSLVQITTFLLALGLTIIFGVQTFSASGALPMPSVSPGPTR